jgi:hypothetical protein
MVLIQHYYQHLYTQSNRIKFILESLKLILQQVLYSLIMLNFLFLKVFPIITSSCYPVILEPYVSLPYYYNSDYNPLINNVDQYRLNSYYQAINYYPGIVTPINFDLLINNSALKSFNT